MNALLRFLAIPCVLLLALPPGWCHAGGVWAGARSEDAGPVSPCGCCQHPPAGRSADSDSGTDSAPGRPTVRCCCPHEVLRTESPVQTDDGAALVADVTPSDAAAVPTRPRGVEEDLSSARRPLAVLQCVWRC